MHRWIRRVSRLIPNSFESNSPIILFSSSSSYSSKTSFHRLNPIIKVDKSKPLATAFQILHRTYTHQNTYYPTPPPPNVVGPAAKDDDDDAGGGGGGIGASNYQRKELPEGLAEDVVKLTCESTAEGGVCDVYVVGTCHISPKSCQEVQAVISFLKPQVVFLELCSSRTKILTRQNVKEGMRAAEFRMGFDEAKKYGGKVILGDRSIWITLQRIWARVSLWEMTKLTTFCVFTRFFLRVIIRKDMDDVDIAWLVYHKMSKRCPTFMEIIVHERDKYMSFTLLRVASEHNLVVAVVGKAHLDGIRKHWKEPIEIMDLLGDARVKASLNKDS